MKNEENIVRYTAEELRAMVARGESRSDWARVRTMTDEDVEAAIASDPDEAGMVVDWSTATMSGGDQKKTMTIRLDGDVLDYYRRMGPDYQTRINAVLRSYMIQTIMDQAKV